MDWLVRGLVGVLGLVFQGAPAAALPEASEKSATWASMQDEVAARLSEGTTKLRPQDWKSGDKFWVVEVIAPFGGAEEMVKDLKSKVFPERAVHYVAVTKEGKKEVKVV